MDHQPLPLLSEQQQQEAIAEAAHDLATSWIRHPNPHLHVEQRVMGAVHGVLDLLENGSDVYNVPAFHLVPVFPGDAERCVREIDNDQGKAMMADWDYGQEMALKPEEGVFDTMYGPSLTRSFEHLYDRTRERFSAAARELFDPNYDPSQEYN